MEQLALFGSPLKLDDPEDDRATPKPPSRSPVFRSSHLSSRITAIEEIDDQESLDSPVVERLYAPEDLDHLIARRLA